ncbi:hypothetical protein KGF57_000269 [Candida theae]|uniref:Zn(2)-C6 fungal-type domain-containing protein n=1 Tax=Candida theae TaxID=1198502 RepID=A0AAD5BK36_9ASCO|nr:uncharacterized protein KGF57_000269 [Candida theae]KAI5968043.1 hypothetical protein KGF57_000269 [Candida theae]
MNTSDIRGKERKSRRTHKNSRDGCPNCKQKRIKCSEELPACHICIKKNYRCGYLDYSEDKLEKLRKKNRDKQHSHITTRDVNNSGQPHLYNHTQANNTDQASGNLNFHYTVSQGVAITQDRPPHEFTHSSENQAPSQQLAHPPQPTVFTNDGPARIEPPQGFNSDAMSGSFSQTYPLNQAPLMNQNTSEIVHGDNLVVISPFTGQNMSIDSSPYSDTPNNVDQLFSSYFPTFIPNQSINSTTPPNIFENAVEKDYNHFNNAPLGNEDLNLVVFTDSIRKLSHFAPPELYVAPEFTEVTNSNIDQNSEEASQKQWDDVGITTSHLERAQDDIKPRMIHSRRSGENGDEDGGGNSGYLESSAMWSSDEPLPNAKRSSIVFKVLKHPDRIKRLFTTTANKFRPEPNQYSLSLRHPDWTRKNNNDLWTITLGEALSSNQAFCLFFIDRGLCVILRVCDKSVKSSSSVSCFTPEIQRILTRKSYAYFGRIIKNLRESVNEVDIQTTTIGSWYAGWSSVLQKRASVKSTTLFYGGSASLLWSCLSECKDFNDLDPRLRFITYAVKNHTSCAVIPDYNISVISNIQETFLTMKKFINYNTDLTSPNNGYILKYFVELEKFLDYLLEDLHPRFVYIDQFYKGKYKVGNKDELGIRYFSPSLFHELINRWLRIIPSHARSIGREMSPLKRTFYLFYIAIAKSLANVFPIIRSAFLVDTWDALYPQTDFDYSLFQIQRDRVSDEAQYNFLSNCTSKLLRIIKFFNTRQQIIAHVLSADTVLTSGKCFIESVQSEHDESREPMQDIAVMTPEKREFGEVMLKNFTINTILNISNYPKLVEFGSNSPKGSDLRKMVERENHRQKVRIEEYRAKYRNASGTFEDNKDHKTNVNHAYDFDFDKGMFSFDYAVEPILTHYFKEIERVSRKDNVSIEELEGQISNFELSFKNMFHSIELGANN